VGSNPDAPECPFDTVQCRGHGLTEIEVCHRRDIVPGLAVQVCGHFLAARRASAFPVTGRPGLPAALLTGSGASGLVVRR
jgi:hypothetical protein